MRRNGDAAGVNGGADEERGTGHLLYRHHSTGGDDGQGQERFMQVYFDDAQEVGLTGACVLAALRNRAKRFDKIALRPVADELGMSYCQVKRWVRRLETLGHIQRRRRPGQWDAFPVLVAPSAQVHPDVTGLIMPPLPATPGSLCPDTGVKMSPLKELRKKEPVQKESHKGAPLTAVSAAAHTPATPREDHSLDGDGQKDLSLPVPIVVPLDRSPRKHAGWRPLSAHDRREVTA